MAFLFPITTWFIFYYADKALFKAKERPRPQTDFSLLLSSLQYLVPYLVDLNSNLGASGATGAQQPPILPFIMGCQQQGNPGGLAPPPPPSHQPGLTVADLMANRDRAALSTSDGSTRTSILGEGVVSGANSERVIKIPIAPPPPPPTSQSGTFATVSRWLSKPSTPRF